jgi:signal transduction histidine kinase
VRVEAREEPRGLVVTVDDDGPGIAPEARLRLFRPFATTKPEGTGLGLALARKFVELHGGEISAETSPLGGARFALVMPKARREVETG